MAQQSDIERQIRELTEERHRGFVPGIILEKGPSAEKATLAFGASLLQRSVRVCFSGEVKGRMVDFHVVILQIGLVDRALNREEEGIVHILGMVKRVSVDGRNQPIKNLYLSIVWDGRARQGLALDPWAPQPLADGH